MDRFGQDCDALVIGGGPAGLMAAEALLAAGRRVLATEAKPSLARKFLMAGKSGLNLTMMGRRNRFLDAYAEAAPRLAPMVDAFGPDAVQAWTEALGQATFTGSTGRLFPAAMKASPLLRAWLARLETAGLERRTRWRWTGWDGEQTLFDTPEGPVALRPRVTVLALGGGSWARLGSDGAWAEILQNAGIPVAPFRPSNAGILVDWSDHVRRHAGTPLKAVALSAGTLRSRGETVIGARGLEGGGLYALTPALRKGAALVLDLAPDLTAETLAKRLARGGRKLSTANRLRRAAGLSPASIALLRECVKPLPKPPEALAAALKAATVPYTGLAPIDEAISTAGGVCWSALDDGLMLTARPGVFCAGEMIDWEAPTGGYLLTACFATGLWAGRHAACYSAGPGGRKVPRD
jgi:uncharacterized flavoprotein (TIGR03862 family)